MIDIGPSRHTVGSLTNRFLNGDGFVQYEANKEYLISVKVYSDRGESYTIANNFEFAFNFDNNLQIVNDIANATVVSTEDITPLPDVLSDESLIEYNQFNVVLAVRDVYVDTSSTTIDSINTVGSYSPDFSTPLITSGHWVDNVWTYYPFWDSSQVFGGSR